MFSISGTKIKPIYYKLCLEGSQTEFIESIQIYLSYTQLY